MKKLFIFPMLALSLFLLSGCGAKGEQTPEPNNNMIDRVAPEATLGQEESVEAPEVTKAEEEPLGLTAQVTIE